MAKAIFVWNGIQFVSANVPIGAVPNAVAILSSTEPSAKTVGQLWVDPSIYELRVWTGSSWQGTVAPIPQINYAVKEISENITISDDFNAYSIGPFTVNEGVLVTLPDGANWCII